MSIAGHVSRAMLTRYSTYGALQRKNPSVSLGVHVGGEEMDIVILSMAKGLRSKLRLLTTLAQSMIALSQRIAARTQSNSEPVP
jgi:hypothetical protein